ncbi:proline rich transmembrane protein 1B [Polypterus senegalus]
MTGVSDDSCAAGDASHSGRAVRVEGRPESQRRSIQLAFAEEISLPSVVVPGPAQQTSTEYHQDIPPDNCGVTNPGFTAEPPPYSPPDPKMCSLLYPPFPPPYPGHVPLVCQPGSTDQLFYQQQLSPSAVYPYTIYMNNFPVRSEERRIPKDYMVESVLVMIFCCMMSGAIAVVYAHEARTAINRGDLVQAEQASLKARSLVIFSLLFGVFVSAGWIVYVLIALYAL